MFTTTFPRLCPLRQTKTSAAKSGWLKLGILGCFITFVAARAADFTVGTPGGQFAFQINGVDSPTLTLIRGQTYSFSVSTTPGFHPFKINSPGCDINNTTSGTIHYTVPTNNADYSYNCGVHGDIMRGEIWTVEPGDFIVTTPNDQFQFNINGTNSPNLTLVRGQTYKFSVRTSPGFHPFHIESSGVDTNDIDIGVITYTVPMDDTNYYYNCFFHGDQMRGEIFTVPPSSPTPPTITILSLVVSNNLVLTSTGTNNWSVNPEFSTNVSSGNWFALTVQTNRFSNGTNETICGKPPGDAVFIRIRSQQN
jgi:hypothetical protein